MPEQFEVIKSVAIKMMMLIGFKKNGKNYFGYKKYVEVDVNHKFIRKYKVTPSSVHDSNVFGEILDKNNTSKDVFADSAYRSKESLKDLEIFGIS